ncbi:MAG: GNAT family N-acetyltransferase [Clostridia bacterium]|nr:GNAT family N-acetyltransferase [Clostridia bacterium]
MITLRKMTEDEFRAFKKFSVVDYASDLMKGRDMNPEQALMEAEEEFDADLPDGLDTEYSFMMNIEDENENRVGWIYFKYYAREDDDQCYVFLEDLLIFESERRKGFASAAIHEMNILAKQDGCSSSVLFVWDHNPEGMSLYEKCGYAPYYRAEGGTYMVKEL